MSKRKAISLLTFLVMVFMLMPVPVMAGTDSPVISTKDTVQCEITAPSNGSEVYIGQTTSVAVKMKTYSSSWQDYCEINIYSPSGILVLNEKKPYGDTFAVLDWSFVPSEAGTYRIKATRYWGGSPTPPSAEITVTAVKATAPSKPVIRAKKKTATSVVVSWKKVSSASGYQIYRSTKKGSLGTRIKTITKSSVLSYTNTRLKKGKTYYYRVRAFKTLSGTRVYSKMSTMAYVRL